jgi:hypothetical protein
MDEKAGVIFFQGWHRIEKWKPPVLKALQNKKWNRSGQQCCNLTRICKVPMEKTRTICRAKKGDLIIFSTTMPHASEAKRA